MRSNFEKYKDIINLPHYVSKKHPQMSIEDRAAQFGAFAALTGYEAEIEETAKISIEERELGNGIEYEEKIEE
ncbi:MAG: hypothetical protein ACLR4X_00360 [Clostridia bacterium]|jgi:hypothetical protein